MNEICCIINKEKTAKNEKGNNDWLSLSFTQCI